MTKNSFLVEVTVKEILFGQIFWAPIMHKQYQNMSEFTCGNNLHFKRPLY